MAEINIEKKKSPKWPWILLAVIILALILFFLFTDDVEEEEIEEYDETEQVRDVEDDDMDESTADYENQRNKNQMENDRSSSIQDGASKDYVAYVDGNKDMGLGHEFSSTAINKLIAATKQQADMYNVDISADLDKARKQAEEITTDPMQVNHADLIKKAGQSIVKALETIQKKQFPDKGDAIQKVRSELQAIKMDDQTLNQKKDVKSFFTAAADLLTQMNKS